MDEIHVAPLLFLREPFSALSHFFGAIVFAVLAVRLVRSGDGRTATSAGLWVLAITTVQTLTISSAYHAASPGALRDFLLRADVAGIFCLISGSITPVHLMLYRGVWRWLPLALSWSVAIIGIGLRLTAESGSPGFWGTVTLIAFGWGAVVTAVKTWRRLGWEVVRGPVLAGLCYTLGAIILLQHKLTILPGAIGPHELWHVFVLCALSLHWAFVFDMTSRLRQAQTEPADVAPDILPMPIATVEPRRRRAA